MKNATSLFVARLLRLPLFLSIAGLAVFTGCQTKPAQPQAKTAKGAFHGHVPVIEPVNATEQDQPFFAIAAARKQAEAGQPRAALAQYLVALRDTDGRVARTLAKEAHGQMTKLTPRGRAEIARRWRVAVDGATAAHYPWLRRTWQEASFGSPIAEALAVYFAPKKRAKGSAQDGFLWESRGWRDTDPYLDNLLRLACKFPNETRQAARDARPRLTAEFHEFLAIYLDFCRKDYGVAEKKLKSLIFKLSELEKQNRNVFLKSASLLVKLSRVNGSSREALANSYFFEMLAYHNSKRPPKNADTTEFLLKKADIAIWAARYRALVGDYFHGEYFLTKAKAILRELLSDRLLEDKERIEATELLAETYHVLAFRILVEQKKYAEAQRQTQQGMKIAGITDKWLQIFEWYSGFYSYLAGNVDQAIHTWESLLVQFPKTSYRPAVFYWLARLYPSQGLAAEGQFYDEQLVAAYPLSFYNLVARCLPVGSASSKGGAKSTNPQSSCANGRAPWLAARPLGHPRPKSLKQRYGKDAAVWQLVERGRGHLRFGQPDLARQSARDLIAKARKTYPYRPHLDLYQEAHKQLIQSGSYLTAIGQAGRTMADKAVAADLSASQMSFGFPRPYGKIYQEQGKRLPRTGAAHLYAITRQESGFQPEVVSSAGAVGLMQIIPPLAKKLLNKPDLSYIKMAAKLKSPELNVRLGAEHLAELDRQFAGDFAAMSAAYNAGSYLVDIWRKRRHHPDPLTWIELVPFLETRNYIKKTWRNYAIYSYLDDVNPES